MFEITRGVIPSALKVVLYGVEGIGKSTFASQFPDPLFIDTEGGSKTFNVARLPAPLSWTMLMDEVLYVRNNPGLCKTLVIDTLDWAEKLACSHVCSLKHWDSIESPGYGAGYRYLYDEIGKLLNLLTDVSNKGIHVLMIAHAAIRKFEQPDEMGSYDRWELKLQTSPKCNIAAMVREYADMVLFANYETYAIQNAEKKNKAQGGKRMMYTSHHPCWDAKNRFGLPEKLPFEFSRVAHCFGMVQQPMQPVVDRVPVQNQPVTQQPVQRPPQPVQPTVKQDVPTAQKPDSVAAAVQQVAQLKQELNEGIPPKLRQLMEANGVTEAQIRHVVAGRGYYPEATPISKYDPAFVEGVLVGAWEQVHKMIIGG